MTKEPALLITLLVVLLRLGLQLLDIKSVDDQTLRTVADVVLTVGGAIWIRARVFSEHTIREAGFTPAQVEARAENPMVHPAEGK